jgi:hypothetical protein
MHAIWSQVSQRNGWPVALVGIEEFFENEWELVLHELRFSGHDDVPRSQCPGYRAVMYAISP